MLADAIALGLAAFALAYAIVESGPMEWPRSMVTRVPLLAPVVECLPCCSFWCVALLMFAAGFDPRWQWPPGAILVFFGAWGVAIVLSCIYDALEAFADGWPK